MAAQALGIVGTVVGSFFGMPQVGYMIGYGIGSLLFPEKLPTAYGPKLGDRKVIASTYGIMLAQVYGTMRIAGNVFWSTEILETANSQTQGGKGGPTQEQVTYSYSQSFAIALCEGPIAGIRKIWANGKLIYTNDSGASVSSLIASTSIAKAIRFYSGTATQSPDSLIQSLAGIGNTSAYRDTAYVLFDNLQLFDYGNRLPNLEFEIVVNGSNTPVNKVLARFPDFPAPFANIVNLSYGLPTFPNLNNTTQTTAYVIGFTSQYDYDNSINWTLQQYRFFTNGNVEPVNRPNVLTYRDSILTLCNKSDNNTVLMASRDAGYIWHYDIYYGSTGTLVNIDSFSNNDSNNSFNYGFQQAKFCFKYKVAVLSTDSLAGSRSISVIDYRTSEAGVSKTVYVPQYTSHIDMSANFIYVIDTIGIIRKYDYDLNLISTVYNGSASVIVKLCVVSDNEIYTFDDNTRRLLEVSTGTAIIKVQLTVAFPDSGEMFVIDSNFYIANCDPGVFRQVYFIGSTLTSNSVFLTDIITDIAIKCGLTSNDIDVTQLAGILVDGFMVAQSSPGRGWIESLMQTYFLDAIESDYKIKFVPRGANPIIIIPEDDLDAVSYGTAPGDQLLIDRKQEMDLPYEVTISYIDKDSHYLTGAQYSRRLTTASVNKVSVQLPVSMSANKAKQIADVLLYDSWQGRNTISFQLSTKYLYLEPTDVVQVQKNNILYTCRIIDKDEGSGIAKFTALAEDVSIYNQLALGAVLQVPTEAVYQTGPTNLKLLDIPLLRDQDNQIGFYSAARGYMDGWKGTQIQKSTDGGSSFSNFGAPSLKAANIGYTTTVLGNFLGGNTFDLINSVTVICPDALSSITELSVLNGGNYALVGSEIIQFKTATLTANNTYKLSGLIRGRQGTEQFISTHASTETFVFLTSSNIYTEEASSTEVGLARFYKGVSLGQLATDASAQSFTYNAVSSKPLSPVQVGGGRDATGNIMLNWIRRGRLSATWNNNMDIPLGEATESYSIDVMSGSIVKRTITNISPTCQYTSAQQITDFGSVQSSVTFKVYQVSATVGRGFAGNGVV